MDGAKEQSTEEFRYGRWIRKISNLFRRLADENLSNHEINCSQLRILGYLSGFDGERDVNQKELEEAFGVRRSSVTSILQNMEKNGILTRITSEKDARVKTVSLTEKGRELDRGLVRFIRNLEDEMMSGIPEEHREILKTALMKMLSNLEETERNKE